MDDGKIPPSDEDSPSIADVEGLFRDTPAPDPVSRPPIGINRVGGDHYEVEDSPAGMSANASDIPSAPIPRVEEVGKKNSTKASNAKSRLEPSEAVEQVWSRGAEWGGTISRLAIAFGVIGVLLYGLLSAEFFFLAFVCLLSGGLVLVLLSYPILVTLERPVRVTPEQALRDYFTAVSHHVPHYRRMWLLLSNAGRVSGSFASFEGFEAYWKELLQRLRSDRASSYTPLKFVVEDFKSEKSAGLTEIQATYTVKVYVRGQQQEGPVETFRVATSLVKGPDRMWYLDRGTLP